VSAIDRRVAIGVVVAAALGVGGYFVFRPTDESQIRAALAKLVAAVQIKEADAQANPIGRLAHLSGVFETLFEPDVRVNIPELTPLQSGRTELVQMVVAAPRFVRTLEVDLGGVTVKLDEAAASAEVGAVADVKAVDRDGTARRDKRAVDFHFIKKDGSWIITTLSVWSKADAAPE
jgi:hypothetical protein